MTTLRWSRITALDVTFDVPAKNAAGVDLTVTTVECALLPYRSRGPNASTVWVAATYDDVAGTATVLVAGPDANAGAGLQLASGSGGGDLWARYISDPAVDAEFVNRIDLLSDAVDLDVDAVAAVAVDRGDGTAVIG